MRDCLKPRSNARSRNCREVGKGLRTRTGPWWTRHRRERRVTTSLPTGFGRQGALKTPGDKRFPRKPTAGESGVGRKAGPISLCAAKPPRPPRICSVARGAAPSFWDANRHCESATAYFPFIAGITPINQKRRDWGERELWLIRTSRAEGGINRPRTGYDLGNPAVNRSHDRDGGREYHP